MTKSGILALLLFIQLGTAVAADCPANYPAGFPCVAGGAVLTLSDLAKSHLAQAQDVIVISYKHDPKALFNALLAESKKTRWTIKSQEEGREPNEIRYRAQFENGNASFSISVFGAAGSANLAVMIWRK